MRNRTKWPASHKLRTRFAALIYCGFAVSITADAHRPSSTQSKAPPPVTVTIHFAGGRTQFRPGETLPIELEFNSRIPHRFAVDGATYDRSGRLMLDDFVVEPIDDVSDPLLDYFALGGFIGGGLRGIGSLGDKPFSVELNLNDWLRFDKPGRYTLFVRSRRVADEVSGSTPPARTVLPIESTPISFEILPRDLGWEASEFASSLRILDSTTMGMDRQQGCRTLRYLGTDAAVDALIAHFDDEKWLCGFDATAGLIGARDRDRAVRQLQAGVRAPDQAVSDNYLRTLALLTVLVQHPELRPVQTRESKGRMAPSPDPQRLGELVTAAKTMYAAALDEALPLKSERVRAMILSWRLEAGRSASSSISAATGTADLRKQLVASFGQLSADRQANLLEYQWPSVAGPDMVPVLRAIVDVPDPAPTSLRDLALRRLYELAPVEARPRILREIANPSPGATLKTLGVLPEPQLPELDDALAANIDLERSGGTFDVRTELLQRYGSPAIAGRVLPKVDALIGRLACRPQAALLAYFLRADAALGRTLLDRALVSREKTGCFRALLKDVARLRMTPELETAATEHLDDQDAQVVISAIETLGRYGSTAALPPLRAHFERWHRTWDGRQEDLRYTHAQNHPDSMQGMVEMTFLQSLGRAQAWLTTEEELRHLRSLCVTDNCRTQADAMISDAGSRRLSLLRIDNPDNDLIRLAQYELTSLSATRQKLAQFPRGTSFTVDANSIDPNVANRIVSELSKTAAPLGITIRREAR